MNANHITATTTINHMRPLTLVAFIRDLADAPDTLPRERADLLRATLDALSASIGAQNAIALLAAADVQADHPIVAGMVDAWVQPDMFPAGEDTPLFTQPDTPAGPGKRIELTYRALSVSSVDVCMDCIAYATPPGTVAGCWAHLEKMRERGEIPQTQYDEIRRMADFIEAD